jgi:hypothetical protein
MLLACSAADATVSTGISSWHSTASLAPREIEPGRSFRFAPGATTIWVLAAGVDEDEGHPGRLVLDLEAAQVDAGLVEPGARQPSELVVPDASDEAHVGAEACRRNGLIRSLAARDPFELGVRHRLTRTRKALAEADEVEVDRADDGDARRQPERLGRERAEVVERAVHEVLPQVEKTGPE